MPTSLRQLKTKAVSSSKLAAITRITILRLGFRRSRSSGLSQRDMHRNWWANGNMISKLGENIATLTFNLLT